MEQILSTFTGTLTAGDSIACTGFGTSSPLSVRCAKGVTRALVEIDIPASTTVKFTPTRRVKAL